MRAVKRKLYSFEELSEKAKEKAIEKWRGNGLDYEWYDTVFEDAKTIGKIMGIKIDKIYFSGFSSQGDGACFEGEYFYGAGSVKAVKEYAPKDERLHQIAKTLQEIQRPAFYHLYAYAKQRGHYNHEMSTEIDVRNDVREITNEQEEQIKDALRDFMRWIYRQLEAEYEYLNSDEVIKENIEANDYEFEESGEMI